jgi:hypothetical protein
MTSRNIAPTTHPSKKATHNSSNARGDKNPPHGKIDSSYKLPVRKKRKNVAGQVEEPKTESEDTPRDHLLTIKYFRDTAYTINLRGPNYFVLRRRGPRDPLLIGKYFRDTGCTSNSRGPNYSILGGRE